MGYLYQGYCYGNGQQVADLMAAEGFQGNSFFAHVTFTGTAYAGQWTTVANGAVSYILLEIPAVACNWTGPISDYSGLSLSDVNTVAWMVAAVFLSVWSIKQIRRAL